MRIAVESKTVRGRTGSVVARTAAMRAGGTTRPFGTSVNPDRDGVKEGFAKLVASKLDGPVLRYSERVRMIREGMKRGIGRFECNLIIAMEEHRAGKVLVPEKREKKGWPVGWVAFAVVQGAIVAGVWWMVG